MLTVESSVILFYLERMIPRQYKSVHKLPHKCIVNDFWLTPEQYRQIAIFCKTSDDFFCLIKFIQYQLDERGFADDDEELYDLVDTFAVERDRIDMEEEEEKFEAEWNKKHNN